MTKTGIFATEKEAEHLRGICHFLAREHGLPEIPGYYGIDLESREFLSEDDVTKIHLCSTCVKDFAVCTSDPHFGTGFGTDNMYCCSRFESREEG
jgi:hypothetical protein